MSEKDFSSISPTAQWLVVLKAGTSIPFAHQAAALLSLDKKDFTTTDSSKQEIFRLLFHFENRYQTIEKILASIAHQNILEFSSGYSFRGLDACLKQEIHFIDTDLPAVIQTKKKLISRLIEQTDLFLKGQLELLPLHVLNKEEFTKTISRFVAGPITLVNEGLLVYLDREEKKELCSIIFRILKERGGCWITGDIYARKGEETEPYHIPDRFVEFRKEHKIDENKFESFEDAEQFFKDCGFSIVKRESFALERLSCLNLLGERRNAVIEKILNSPHSRESWMLAAE